VTAGRAPRRGRLPRAAAAGSAALALGVVVAPALVVAATGRRVGAADTQSGDLVATGVAVGAVAAVLAWRRVRRPPPPGTGAATIWIATLWGLLATALTASSLPPLVLHLLARVLTDDPGWRAPTVWTVCLLVAVAAGEGTHRGIRRWLSAA
jgi:hypothetical protein